MKPRAFDSNTGTGLDGSASRKKPSTPEIRSAASPLVEAV
jgi:hypothetical protein